MDEVWTFSSDFGQYFSSVLDNFHWFYWTLSHVPVCSWVSFFFFFCMKSSLPTHPAALHPALSCSSSYSAVCFTLTLTYYSDWRLGGNPGFDKVICGFCCDECVNSRPGSVLIGVRQILLQLQRMEGITWIGTKEIFLHAALKERESMQDSLAIQTFIHSIHCTTIITYYWLHNLILQAMFKIAANTFIHFIYLYL